jgi:hypothetical protein
MPRRHCVEELVRGVLEGRPSAVDAALPVHVLDAMQGVDQAAATGRRQRLRTSVAEPSRVSVT